VAAIYACESWMGGRTYVGSFAPGGDEGVVDFVESCAVGYR